MSDPDKVAGALVVPLCARELPALARNLLLWETPGFSPFGDGPAVPRMALRLLWNDGPDAGREAFIDEVLRVSGGGACFSEVAHDYCRLDAGEDHYDRRPTSGPVSDLGFYAGPNRMFFEMMERLGPLYPAILLMETDCFPLAPGWLRGLFEGFAANPSAWVVGSRYSGIGRLPRSKHRHLNGNALYRTGDPQFLDFVLTVWKAELVRHVRDRDPQVAYDSFLEELASEWAPTTGRDSLGGLKRTLEERFHATPLMKNYGGREDTRRLGWTLARARRKHPEALVVHGQWFAREVGMIVSSDRGGEWDEIEAAAAAFAKAGGDRPAGAPVWRSRVELGGSAWFCEGRLELPAERDRLLFRHRLSPGLEGRRLEASVRLSEPTSEMRVEALLVSMRERPAGVGVAALAFFAWKALERISLFVGLGIRHRAAMAGHRRWRVDQSGPSGGGDFEFAATCPAAGGALELWLEISADTAPASGALRVEACLRE
jgi:hypothetical protein